MKNEELIASSVPFDLREDLRKIEEIEHLDIYSASQAALFSNPGMETGILGPALSDQQGNYGESSRRSWNFYQRNDGVFEAEEDSHAV